LILGNSKSNHLGAQGTLNLFLVVLFVCFRSVRRAVLRLCSTPSATFVLSIGNSKSNHVGAQGTVNLFLCVSFRSVRRAVLRLCSTPSATSTLGVNPSFDYEFRFDSRKLEVESLRRTAHLSPLSFCSFCVLQECAARGSALVLDALCDVYSRAMGCLRRLLAPLLPELLDQLGASFSRTPVVGCLSCITQVLIHTNTSHSHLAFTPLSCITG